MQKRPTPPLVSSARNIQGSVASSLSDHHFDHSGGSLHLEDEYASSASSSLFGFGTNQNNHNNIHFPFSSSPYSTSPNMFLQQNSILKTHHHSNFYLCTFDARLLSSPEGLNFILSAITSEKQKLSERDEKGKIVLVVPSNLGLNENQHLLKIVGKLAKQSEHDFISSASTDRRNSSDSDESSGNASHSNRLSSPATPPTQNDQLSTIVDEYLDELLRPLQQLYKQYNSLDTHTFSEYRAKLRNLFIGVSLLADAAPKVIAKIVGCYSEMVCNFLLEYLQFEGERNSLTVALIDSKKYLVTAIEEVTHSDKVNFTIYEQRKKDQYLRAHYDSPLVDTDLIEELNGHVADVLIAPGNIGCDNKGDIVLFDISPNSDMSVAIFATKLDIGSVDFWTKDGGIFTCSEMKTTNAKFVFELSYHEALEIATSDNFKVLQPRSLKILQESDIQIRIRSVKLFNRFSKGYLDKEYITVIKSESSNDDTDNEQHDHVTSLTYEEKVPHVKCICIRRDILMLSIDTLDMWQKVGFLADVFGKFKKYNISVDFVTTSEANITITLDATNKLDNEVLNKLVNDLRSMNCRVEIIGPCSALSLIGKNIRSFLPRLSSGLTYFSGQKIHSVALAASDVNLTFLLDQNNSNEQLLKELHDWVFIKQSIDSHYIGPTWSELFETQTQKVNDVSGKHVWWRRKRQQLLDLIEKEDQAIYVYDVEQFLANAQKLINISIRNNGPVDQIFFALKSNPHPEILKIFESVGFGLECVSIDEVRMVCSLFPNIDRANRILFTPNFAPKKEYREALSLGVMLTIDSLYPLMNWGELLRGKSVLLRIDPGAGKGHHAKVKTSGVQSKFGIHISDIPQAVKLCAQYNITVIGLHAHVGSGILDEAEAWKKTAVTLAQLIAEHPKLMNDVKMIDCGGGLGVPYVPYKQTELDLSEVAKAMIDFKKNHNPTNVKLCMEPGRFLTANAGVLLARVTQIKNKMNKLFVGIETGMNSLIRPTLYDAHHEIVNLSKISDPNSDDPAESTMIADIVGPICESGDVFGTDRAISSETREGDVLCICTAGSYGYSMSSHYNNRVPAKEIFILPQNTKNQ
ncbi:hypothetical protein FDP41_013429 [Naegleria fowleri]|uniref:ACT domain-containing protein n=1 Tax=Naegleria fowleri TaxID=5763 RepID=A0A6A5C3Z6_NAEFO|nr:uncharacterized protein FDP41_013429 [Naegleria fowleri]KAF0980215.1 hypothetical protein FDP41_013429 [Naegleria fowleri]